MLIRLLSRFIKPHLGLFVLVVVFQFVSVICSLFLPNINATIIDNGLVKGDIGYIWAHGGIMLLVAFGQIVAALIATFIAAMMAMKAGRDMRNEVFARVSSFSEREVTHFSPGSLITRNTNDVQQVQMLAMMGSTSLIAAPIMAIGGIIMALQQDIRLSWLIAVAVPIMLIAGGGVVSRMMPQFRKLQHSIDGINLVFREQLTGIRVIRAFVREPIEERRFRDASTEVMAVGRKVGSLFVFLFPAIMLIMNVVMVAVLWFGAKEIDAVSAPDQGTRIGTLFAFMQYVGLILGGVLVASFVSMMIPRAAVSAERVLEVLDTKPTLHRPDNGVTAFPTPGTVEFRSATFQYPSADFPILNDISFTVRRGETVAIVGSTGAGKTTLISLIPRLFDLTSGTVLVNGTDVREADLEALWKTIGFVPQRPFLFSGTVASNLRYGREDATDEELWRALEIAQGRDFVEAMDGQLAGTIAQGGTNVSGGQRQRLAIARAIVHKPDILVFDDSFSALDLTTDANLRKALWHNLPEVTKVVVAQRVSTITEADQIVVLDDGVVVGVGRHEVLLETCETYHEIVESQLGMEAAQA